MSSLARLLALRVFALPNSLFKAAPTAIKRGRQGEVTEHLTDLPVDAGRVKMQFLGFRVEAVDNAWTEISKGRGQGGLPHAPEPYSI